MNRREMLALSAALPFANLRAADPVDVREVKTLNSYFPLAVPKTLEDWKSRRERVVNQIRVALGDPIRQTIKPTIHGSIEREHYTIEKVFFASLPGHYVCGNLYRPKTPHGAAVLFAHGHWKNGRFMENDDKSIAKAIETKAEGTKESAKYHMQAACATLARRGYFVFQYDMVGVADSTAIGHVAKSGVPHPNGFATVEAELRLQSLMGLQAQNSIAAVDFISSLPGVDAKRIGMTGASGGGTQTFITAALDDRIACAVPAVMVSTGMQGGCVCENCSLLRVGTGNVEIAACIAPRPLALTCADDWTKEFPTKGFPELKAIYALHGRPDLVQMKAWPQYPHNYNQPAREFMYQFFAKHLEGKDETVSEPPFVPVPPAELSVFDAQHPRPMDETDAKKLMEAWHGPRTTKPMVRAALRAMVCDEMPSAVKIHAAPKESKVDGCTVHRTWLGRPDETDAMPTQGMFGPKFDGTNVLIWIHPDGIASLVKDNKLVSEARTAIDAGYAIITGDLYAKPLDVNKVYAGFTFGYNRTLLAQRVHDILTLAAFAKTVLKAKNIRMVGWGEAGPWAALASVLANVDETMFDGNQFEFKSIKNATDPMMLPGALKYGDLMGLAGANEKPFGAHNVKYWSSGNFDAKQWTGAAVMEWLLK